MKRISILLSVFLFILIGCTTTSDFNQVLEDMQENLDVGNLSTIIQIADSLKKYSSENKEILHIADSLKQIAERTEIDFSVTEDQVIKQIENLNGPVSSEQKSGWEKNGWLEWRMIDGEKKYFKRAASNLMLIKKFYEKKDKYQKETGNNPAELFRLKHTEQVVKSTDDKSNPTVPVNMEITYTITVHPDVVPEGEKIRCWLPWPKVSHLRQKEVKLLSTSNPEYSIAPDTAIHSTIYMEALSKKGVPTIFQISYSYVSEGQYFDISRIKILPYDKVSDNYQKNTSEQLPHICFTDYVKQIADSITGNDEDPASVVRKIYFWFKENILWTGALEYSIIPNIPEYVIQNKRGDCGMQTFLFMSMLRYKGIPVRWQSGWMMPPDNENLHDWCEVYYEGPGWVPVDVRYDLQKSENSVLKNFFISGIDSYRLIINDGVAGPLHPEKQYLRSEPYDFQRGEVEWKGGNLYFDKWDYDMKIRYVK
ncbi:MAG: transglutaminase-like domain-containing protein [Bacteroidales bacterium]